MKNKSLSVSLSGYELNLRSLSEATCLTYLISSRLHSIIRVEDLPHLSYMNRGEILGEFSERVCLKIK
jgi:hypothetical protein